MDFRILEFMVVLAFVKRIWSLPLSCLYNGMSHKEGETVRTDEPCLSCICQNGVLECSLRVCAEYPNVLPPGCFLLHKPNHCCLQIFCDENFSPIGVELQTSFKSENKLHENDCIINGSIYGEGSAVASSQPCEYCYCVEGEIKCIKPRCPHPFEGCKAVYEKSSCCPMHYDCRESNVSFLTPKIKNFEYKNVTVSKNSLRSHFNSGLESEKRNLNASENDETDLSKTEFVTEGSQSEESSMAIIEKRNTEETTVIPVQKSNVPVLKDYLTIPDFQIMKPDSFSKKPGIVAFAEDGTLAIKTSGNVSLSVKEKIEEAPEIQMRRTLDTFKGIESSVRSYDGSGDNASHEIVDYDSYDYSEPQLPPSLPNLVIFPFVAADAVVKSESTEEPDSYGKDQMEKINTQVFYKDYFTPPIKSEGGFVPKKPLKSEEPFYQHAYLGKEQVESPNENAVATSQATFFPQGSKELNFSVFANNTGTNATTANKPDSDLNVTVNPIFEGIMQSGSDTEAKFLLPDDDQTTTLHKNNQTKKPVTVTFKNFVVDFYPNYMITTSKRIQYENETQITAGESFRLTQKPQVGAVPLDTTRDPTFSFYDDLNTSAPSEGRRESPIIIPINPPGGETFFFDKFIHSFLSGATSTGTTAMTSTSKKHKFSSKIKNQLITTVKPKREKIIQKVELKVDITNLPTESHSALPINFSASFSVPDKSKNYNEKRKPVKAEDITKFIETLKSTEAKNEKVELSESLSGEKLSILNREPGTGATENKNNCVTTNAGALLKLAGCNIYGMMYRVGKVITELSGPCLECLCTDLGVQCKPLKC